ncbi:MAG: fused MFS/spermidine synthase, partial [Pseudomonadota bacterium]
ALLLARGEKSGTIGDTGVAQPESRPEAPAAEAGPSLPELRALAFLSGVVTLCLQVLWTRMFAQVLQNSVYTFSIILVVFLLFLALGAWLANRLMSFRVTPAKSLFVLLTLGALLVAITPFVFTAWTDGLRYIGTHEGWTDYVLKVFGVAMAVMGPPLVLLGAVFPLLLKLAEIHDSSAGRSVGRLTALNTLGAITGSLAAGFVLLDFLGLWASIRLMGILYFLVALYHAQRMAHGSRSLALVPALGILLLVSALDTSRLPLVRVDPVIDDESLLETWEGSAGTVAVIRRGTDLKIKVNNFYTLGGTASHELEQLQGYLPVLLHPAPETVYMLGLGTGITAGATLKFPIKKLVVTELLADVVTASDKYFGRYTNDLFFDPRAKVVIEDGRNYLQGTSETFDVITGDLFVPWKAGAGSLYTLEHFRSVARRLNERGVFVQWLPAYQLSQHEFAVIARTMLEVFPQVTVWRGDFSALKPIIGLMGQNKIHPLPPDALMFSNLIEGEGRVPLLANYVGNLSAIRPLFEGYALNRDDRPLIEFQAPVAQRMTKAGALSWLAGEQLIHFMNAISDKSPFATDPYLARLSPEQRKLPAAALHLHKAQVLRQKGRLSAAKQELQLWRELSGADR